MIIFNESRSAYYKAKKRELERVSRSRAVIQEDALFIHYYGMSAYLELFPEAKQFGVSWHRDILKELQKIREKYLGQELSGVYMAYGAIKSKKVNRNFRKLIKQLTSK